MQVRMSLGVMIPSHGRPDDLRRNLEALANHKEEIDQVVVVVRRGDVQTRLVVESASWPILDMVEVDEPGVIPAMNAGWDAMMTDIVAQLDDDAVIRPGWTDRIRYHLARPDVAGVGGRDHIIQDGQALDESEKTDVGRLAWFGRVVGNHHVGIGPAREVDVLKGVNMAFRRAVVGRLRFDRRLRRRATFTHWELAFCLALRRAGWKLIYDPMLAVDHYDSPRPASDGRDRHTFSSETTRNAVYNQTLILLEHMSSLRRVAFCAWALLAGTRDAPGVAQVPRGIIRKKASPSEALKRWWASMNGRWDAICVWLNLSVTEPEPDAPARLGATQPGRSVSEPAMSSGAA